MRDSECWVRADAGLFTAMDRLPSGRKRHRVVEKLPDAGWDWSVWISGGSGDAQYGREATVTEAMTAADLASAGGCSAEELERLEMGLQSGSPLTTLSLGDVKA